MSRGWTPESHVSVTDAGMVIEIKMKGIKPFSMRGRPPEEGHLCFRGQHEDFGPFEVKFRIPPGYNVANVKIIHTGSTLRIEIPPGGKSSLLDVFPQPMLIYCNGCGKHFDIVITGKGPHDYTCPACGKVQAFDLEALVNQVMEQCKNISRKKRGRL